MEPTNKKHIAINKIYDRISFSIRVIEIFLASLLIIAVLIAAIYTIIAFVKDYSQLNQLMNYNNFQQLLSYILLLIIALELSIMLIRHNPNNVVDVMIYAIARKMLIHNNSSLEMLIAIATLAILFLLKKYLMKEKTDGIA